MEIPITIDSREPAEFIHQIKSISDKRDIKTRKPIFKITVDALKIGDFLLNNTICIERKTADDFISSIVDKRLFRQVEDMIKQYGHANSYLLIEGSLEKRMQWSRTKISRESVYGALRWVSEKCNVINTTNTVESARFIISMAKQSVKEDNPQLPRMVIQKPRENETDIKRWQLAVLQTFPKIGVSISSNILKYYGNLINFFNKIVEGDIPEFKMNNKEECIAMWRKILTEEIKEMI
ncbi:MAG: hypothetical protein DRI44_05695 [Chlamydiae bacterium]|nr:MAG: hypothetical protein DRI44_05695 [Chlamydiota bacterium]